MFLGTAPWGASVSRVHRSALLGQSLTWRSLGRSLFANAMRVQLCLCFAAGCGQPQNTASSQQVYYRKKTSF